MSDSGMPIKHDGEVYSFQELVDKIKKEKPGIKSPGGYVKTIEENQKGAGTKPFTNGGVCPECAGKGKDYRDNCPTCEGTGKQMFPYTGKEIDEHPFNTLQPHEKYDMLRTFRGINSGRSEHVNPRYENLSSQEQEYIDRTMTAKEDYSKIKTALASYKDVVDAFKNKEKAYGGNYHSNGEQLSLFGNKIAEHTENGIRVSNAGYATHTAHKALRQLGVPISRKSGQTMIGDKPYKDGDWVELHRSELTAKLEDNDDIGHPFDDLDEDEKIKIIREHLGYRWTPPVRNPSYSDLDLVTRECVDAYYNKEKAARLSTKFTKLANLSKPWDKLSEEEKKEFTESLNRDDSEKTGVKEPKGNKVTGADLEVSKRKPFPTNTTYFSSDDF
jgi:hypothetical protein